jgi:mannose-6-phosphate isomerase
MGTHPQGPSFVQDDPASDRHGTALSDLIKANPSLHLSDEVAREYNNDLPFLFKVLSVRKSLSIQAHPDKALARELHTKFPTFYKGAD